MINYFPKEYEDVIKQTVSRPLHLVLPLGTSMRLGLPRFRKAGKTRGLVRLPEIGSHTKENQLSFVLSPKIKRRHAKGHCKEPKGCSITISRCKSKQYNVYF